MDNWKQKKKEEGKTDKNLKKLERTQQRKKNHTTKTPSKTKIKYINLQ